METAPVLPPPDHSHHYVPTVDATSEFPWHHPEIQSQLKEEQKHLNFSQFTDPWENYKGNVPPIESQTVKYDQHNDLEITKEMRNLVWECSSKHQENRHIQTDTHESQHLLSHNKYTLCPNHNEQSVSYSDLSQSFHQDLNHGQENQAQHYGTEKQYHESHIQHHENQTHHESQYQHHESQCQSNNLHYQYSHHTQILLQNDHSQSAPSHNHINNDNNLKQNQELNYDKQYNGKIANQYNQDIISSHNNITENNSSSNNSQQIILHTDDNNFPRNYKSERNEKIDLKMSKVTNGFTEDSKLNCNHTGYKENIRPRHPYDGYYLKHISTIDPRGYKICSHEIPKKPCINPLPPFEIGPSLETSSVLQVSSYNI